MQDRGWSPLNNIYLDQKFQSRFTKSWNLTKILTITECLLYVRWNWAYFTSFSGKQITISRRHLMIYAGCKIFSKPLSKLVLAYIPTTLAYEQNRPKAHGSAVEEDTHTHSHRQSAFAMPLGPSLKVLVRPGVILVLCQHTEGLEGGIPPTDAKAACKGPRSHVGSSRHKSTPPPST